MQDGQDPFTISPAVLRWAREQRGLTIPAAARSLGIVESTLVAIENGEKQPSLPQLRKMVTSYKRPLIVLLLDEPPTTFTALKDFRRLHGAPAGEFSPQLHDEIKRAIDQQEAFAELQAQLHEEITVPKLPAGSPEDPQALGRALVDLLGVDASDRRKWSNGRVSYVEWRSRVEGLGILVLETSRVKVKEMRGFSLSERRPYVIVVNGEDADRGKTFSLLHELAHLCRRQPGVCDLHRRAITTSDIEVYCNAVASEALLPAAWLSQIPSFAQHAPGTPWSDADVDAIVAAAGGPSHEVVLRRLLALNLITTQDYQARVRTLHELYEEWRAERRKKDSKGGPPPHRLQLRDRGKPFIRSVFNAYADGIVNLSEVSDLAGVKTRHLRIMQAEAYK